MRTTAGIATDIIWAWRFLLSRQVSFMTRISIVSWRLSPFYCFGLSSNYRASIGNAFCRFETSSTSLTLWFFMYVLQKKKIAFIYISSSTIFHSKITFTWGKKCNIILKIISKRISKLKISKLWIGNYWFLNSQALLMYT